MANLGQRNVLPIVRSAPPGFYLDGGTHGEILLPGSLIPSGAKVGGTIEVFVYRDSEDRLVATTEKPHAMVGDFARLRVVGINQRIGVFLDWGLGKDLLLPAAELNRAVTIGDGVVVRIALDPKSDRIIATTKLHKFLDQSPPPYHEGETVRLFVASKSPLGYNLIINHAHRGLIFNSELKSPLRIGDTVEGFVRAIRPDGKIDISLGKAGFRRIESNTEIVLAALQKAPLGWLGLHDKSPPDEVWAKLGLSKKAFKQAIGALYREELILIEETGIRLVKRPARPTPPA